MTSNKKLGNFTGKQTLPSAAGAQGAYVSPSEVYQQRLVGGWPATPVGAWVDPGQLVYALSSGVVSAISGTNYAICDGSEHDRTAFASLYAVVGNRYGNGNGISTFNTPPMTPRFGYTKATTGSGVQAPSGVAVLPNHTHTLEVGGVQNPGQASNGGGGATDIASFTFQSSFDGGGDNHGRHVEVIPLLSNTAQTAPVGTVVICLTPNNVSAISAVAPINTVVASGQALSRTTYAKLFERIGTLYGSGNGTTTFNLPDYRGVFLRAPVGRNTIQPSGYLNGSYGEDGFVSHRHGYNPAYYLASGGRRCDYTPIGTATTTPASGPSSIGIAGENRPANITCTYLVVVSEI